MRLFHFNMVKMPSFYPVFSFGMPEAFYWLSLWNFKKETSAISCGTPDFLFNSFLFILLVAASCRNELLSRSLPTRWKPWEGKGNFSGERFFLFFHSPHLSFSKDFRVYRIPVLWFYGMRPSVHCIVLLKRNVWNFYPCHRMRLFHSNMVKMPSFYPVFWDTRGILLAVPLELQERNISHFLWHTGFFIQFILFYLLSYLVGGCFLPERTPFA